MNADQIRARCPHLVGVLPGRVLRLERCRTTKRCDPDCPRDGQLYPLPGSLDTPVGTILFPGISTNAIAGDELLAPSQRAKALGLSERPLGPSRWEFVTSDELYTAALESRPYRVRGLVGFGANLLIANADGRRGREALASLDFYVHTDLFMNPTAEMADIVLPVASPFETEALKIGFEVSEEAQSLILPAAAQEYGATSRLSSTSRPAPGGPSVLGRRICAALPVPTRPERRVAREFACAAPRGMRSPKPASQVCCGDDGAARGFHAITQDRVTGTFLAHGYSPLRNFASR